MLAEAEAPEAEADPLTEPYDPLADPEPYEPLADDAEAEPEPHAGLAEQHGGDGGHLY